MLSTEPKLKRLSDLLADSHGFFFGSLEKKGELVPTVSRNDVLRANLVFEQGGDVFQQGVTGRVSERVVVSLEVVAVDQLETYRA